MSHRRSPDGSAGHCRRPPGSPPRSWDDGDVDVDPAGVHVRASSEGRLDLRLHVRNADEPREISSVAGNFSGRGCVRRAGGSPEPPTSRSIVERRCRAHQWVSVGERIAFTLDVMLVSSTRLGVPSPGDDRPMVVRTAAVARLLVSRGRQVFCRLHGHDMLLHFEPNRLSLQCVACGAETPGWRLDVNPYLRPRRPPAVIRVTVGSEEAGSRPSGERHEPDASGLAPQTA